MPPLGIEVDGNRRYRQRCCPNRRMPGTGEGLTVVRLLVGRNKRQRCLNARGRSFGGSIDHFRSNDYAWALRRGREHLATARTTSDYGHVHAARWIVTADGFALPAGSAID